jgi:hypothetical protein
MKKLQLELGELSMAFEDASWETSYFLDMETGQVVSITQDTRWQLETIIEEHCDPESEEPMNLAAVLQEHDLPDWEKEFLLEADQIDCFRGSRYIGVPRADSPEGYRDMEDFILTVQDKRLQERLWWAIEGRGAFRRFKDVLAAHYREQKRWYAFKDDRVTTRILHWLESEGIEPIITAPAFPADAEPTAPSARERLMTEVLAFTQSASRLSGVTRIALIGSLTTDEPDPKDADLLVSVTEDMDLAPLAKLGRQLQGRTQSFRHGGEVFLADPDDHYLGRTCPWKRCGPGIRVSCDALHCGRRSYLHDDLQVVRLAEDLVAEPPIELWPLVLTRVPVPEDVERNLLQPLRKRESDQ